MRTVSHDHTSPRAGKLVARKIEYTTCDTVDQMLVETGIFKLYLESTEMSLQTDISLDIGWLGSHS